MASKPEQLDAADDVDLVLDRRLRVLEQLAWTLSAAKPGRPEAMIEFLEQRTAALCGLLAEWARLEATLEKGRARSPEVVADAEQKTRGGVSEQPEESKPEESRQLLIVLEDLQWRCRVEAAVLRHSRRTASALSGLWTGGDATYARPELGAARPFLVGKR